MNTLLGAIGAWLIADGIISIRMYYKQSWLKDHSVRLLRVCCGLAVIIIGAVYECK